MFVQLASGGVTVYVDAFVAEAIQSRPLAESTDVALVRVPDVTMVKPRWNFVVKMLTW